MYQWRSFYPMIYLTSYLLLYIIMSETDIKLKDALISEIPVETETETEGALVVKSELDPALLTVPFDELPKRKLNAEEREFIRTNLDEKKKIVLMNNLIKFDDGSALRFRFDTRLMKNCKDDVRFCMAVYGAMRFPTPDDVKKYMLKYIRDDFDDEIEEVHIFRKGNADEHDTCIILNPEDDEVVLWVKFLRQKLTDKIWNDVEESKAGTGSVLINQTLGRDDQE
jgi:hypothetical protein